MTKLQLGVTIMQGLLPYFTWGEGGGGGGEDEKIPRIFL